MACLVEYCDVVCIITLSDMFLTYEWVIRRLTVLLTFTIYYVCIRDRLYTVFMCLHDIKPTSKQRPVLRRNFNFNLYREPALYRCRIRTKYFLVIKLRLTEIRVFCSLSVDGFFHDL